MAFMQITIKSIALFGIELFSGKMSWAQITDNANQYQWYKFLPEKRFSKTGRWLSLVFHCIIERFYYWTEKPTTEFKLDLVCVLGPYTKIDALTWIIIDEFDFNANVSSSCTRNIFCLCFIQYEYWGTIKRMNYFGIRWHFQFHQNWYL